MQDAISRLSLPRQYWKGLVILACTLTISAWLLNTPPGILGKADAIGYAVCHRIDLRSFFIGEIQMPLCARCSGMYLGAMVGLIFQAVIGKKRVGTPPWKVIVPTAIFAVLFAIDGLNSFYHLISGTPGLYPPHNILRLLTGTGMGLAIAVALFPAFNATVWKMVDPRSALSNLRSFGLMTLVALGISSMILLEIPVILYPLALLSAAGVIVLLTLVYTMVLMMVFKAENRYNQISKFAYAIVGGLTIALVQIGLLDILRYFFTGTWDGFHL